MPQESKVVVVDPSGEGAVDPIDASDRKTIISELRRMRDEFTQLADKLDNFVLNHKPEPSAIAEVSSFDS